MVLSKLRRNSTMSYFQRIKAQDFTLEFVQKICDSINHGYSVEIKREGNDLVIVEMRRNVVGKKPIE